MNYFEELDKIERLPVKLHSLTKSVIKEVGENWNGKTLKDYTQEWIDRNYLCYYFTISGGQCQIGISYTMVGLIYYLDFKAKTTQGAVKKAVREFYKRYNKH